MAHRYNVVIDVRRTAGTLAVVWLIFTTYVSMFGFTVLVPILVD